MKPRRLKLDSGTWRFIVGPIGTTLWTPSGRRLNVLNWEIGGKIAGRHYCGDWRCTATGLVVTPGKLRSYIEANLL